MAEILLTLLFRAVTHIHIQRETNKEQNCINKMISIMQQQQQQNDEPILCFKHNKLEGMIVRHPNSHKETLHPAAYRGRPLQESLNQAAGQSLLNEAAICNSYKSPNSQSSIDTLKASIS